MCGEVRDVAALSTTEEDIEMETYFFFNPVFIIGMLILFVIMVIIVSWYLQKLKNNKENSEKKLKESDLLDKNAEVLEGLLTSISDEESGRRAQANFGPTTEKVFCSDQPATEVGLEEECVPGKIITIIPDKDFRNFPKTEEEQMKMRRHNMLQMLSLPPLT